MLRMDIAARLDQAMQIAGFKSHAALSRASGIPESTITRILKLSGNPSVETIAALAKVLNVSMDWIVTGETNDNAAPPEHIVIFDKAELDLIKEYRQANLDGKNLLKAAAHACKTQRLNETE